MVGCKIHSQQHHDRGGKYQGRVKSNMRKSTHEQAMRFHFIEAWIESVPGAVYGCHYHIFFSLSAVRTIIIMRCLSCRCFKSISEFTALLLLAKVLPLTLLLVAETMPWIAERRRKIDLTLFIFGYRFRKLYEDSDNNSFAFSCE